jgi:hypothetical protein
VRHVLLPEPGSSKLFPEVKESNAMSKLRIGIIGAGGIAAKMHLPELAVLQDRCEITLIAGRKPARLQTLLQSIPDAQYTNDYETVWKGPNVDAVIIATPHPHHVSWGLQALAAGKHVMMQKPLSGDMAEANAFVAAAVGSHLTDDGVCRIFPRRFIRCEAGNRAGHHWTYRQRASAHSHGGLKSITAKCARLFW